MGSYCLPDLRFDTAPEVVLKVHSPYQELDCATPNSNFLKEAKWSPDGAALLTASDDNRLRVYDLPKDILNRPSIASSAERDLLASAEDNHAPALQVKEAETIFDYCWYSAMSAADPVSCCFACTSRGQPVHMWDACTGQLRCTYRAYDAVDEIIAANSLGFSPDGSKLYAGYDRNLKIWDTSRPGREYQEVPMWRKSTDKNGRGEGLPGIVSCMDFNPVELGMMALGSYFLSTALFDSRSNQLTALLEGSSSGFTQVKFAPDGNFLFTALRNSGEIWCWDVRYQSGVVYKIHRDTQHSHQRIAFHIVPCGTHLATGTLSGAVKVFKLSTGKEVADWCASDDTVNGLQFHPSLPLAASASGHRRYRLSDKHLHPTLPQYISGDSDSESETDTASKDGFAKVQAPKLENSLLVWKFQHDWLTLQGTADDTLDTESSPVEDPCTSPKSTEAVDTSLQTVQGNATTSPSSQEALLEIASTSPRNGIHSASLAGIGKLVPFGQELKATGSKS